MNTVDSWIDPEWIAELVDRLGQPPGSEDGEAAPVGAAENAEEVKTPRASGEKIPDARVARFPEMAPAPAAASPRTEVPVRQLRSAVEVVTKAEPERRETLPVPQARPDSSSSSTSPRQAVASMEEGVVLSPEGVESLARLASRIPEAAPEALRDRSLAPVMELSQREKVQARLAELRAQIKSADLKSEPWPFSSAE